MNYKIEYVYLSHIGNVRKVNQDNYICESANLDIEKFPEFAFGKGEFSNKDLKILGVFDGMGGEQCGEDASRIASECAKKLVLGKEPASDLEKFLFYANDEIIKFADENGVVSMGSTAALLGFGKHEIALCNIGDSKIFKINENGIWQISEDHLAAGPAGTKPALWQSLGMAEEECRISPYKAYIDYCDNDYYLICSDGLTDMVSMNAIAAIVLSSEKEAAIDALLKKALENGGRDNITIVLCKVQKEGGFLGLI